MAEDAAALHKTSAGSFYDRIVKLYNLSLKLNGYARSLDIYLRDNPLPLSPGARVLDAGCGTGLLSSALLRAVELPFHIAAVDLSASSLLMAKQSLMKEVRRAQSISFAQANVLRLPFSDHCFDLVVTSGVLEYVSLREGFKELSRVLAPGGHMLHLPVRPSFVSTILEVLFRFKAHSPMDVAENTNRYFRVLNQHRFPPLEPIGWTKTAILAQKI